MVYLMESLALWLTKVPLCTDNGAKRWLTAMLWLPIQKGGACHVELAVAQQIFNRVGFSLPEGLDALARAEQDEWISELEVRHDDISFHLSTPKKKSARVNNDASAQSTIPEGLV